jgi:hypothetical protein
MKRKIKQQKIFKKFKNYQKLVKVKIINKLKFKEIVNKQS